MKIDDSKKAFPGTKENGMTLYDYYVGQVLSGLMANPLYNDEDEGTLVSKAHRIAEETIKQKRDNYV